MRNARGQKPIMRTVLVANSTQWFLMIVTPSTKIISTAFLTPFLYHLFSVNFGKVFCASGLCN